MFGRLSGVHVGCRWTLATREMTGEQIRQLTERAAELAIGLVTDIVADVARDLATAEADKPAA